nr:hypothetical protein CFP56_00549 [Quercus suber]
MEIPYCPSSSGMPTSNTEDALQPHSSSELPPLVLDPNNSERQYWRDPYSGVLREIWRPGDPDGAPDADYHGRCGPPPAEGRWRFYQVQTGHGPVSAKNVPPAYVVLDDLAAWQVYVSDIPLSHRAQFWSHDFAGAGSIRSQRRHRGRGALGDPNADGIHQYFFGHTAAGTYSKHYFIGEQNHRAVVYIDPNAKRRAVTPPLAPAPQKKRAEKRASEPQTPDPKKVIQGRGTSSSSKRPAQPSSRVDPVNFAPPAARDGEPLAHDQSRTSSFQDYRSGTAKTILTINSTDPAKSGPPSAEGLFMDAGNACSPLIPSSSSHKTNSVSKTTAFLNAFTPSKPTGTDSSDPEDAVQVFPFYLKTPSPMKNSSRYAHVGSDHDSSPLRHCTSCLQPRRKVDLESSSVRQGREISSLQTRVSALEAFVNEYKKSVSMKLEDASVWE